MNRRGLLAGLLGAVAGVLTGRKSQGQPASAVSSHDGSMRTGAVSIVQQGVWVQNGSRNAAMYRHAGANGINATPVIQLQDAKCPGGSIYGAQLAFYLDNEGRPQMQLVHPKTGVVRTVDLLRGIGGVID